MLNKTVSPIYKDKVITDVLYLHELSNHHPLQIIPQNYRYTFSVAQRVYQNNDIKLSSRSHFAFQPKNSDEIFELIIKQPHTLNFRS